MPTSSEALQRVSPAAVLPAVLAELGIDPTPIFEGLSFDPEDLVPSARLPFAEAALMLERASHAAGQPEFGIRVGVRNDYRCLGLAGELMAAAPDLGRALTDYVGVHGGLSQAASSYLIPMGDSVALGFGIYDRQMIGAEQVYGLAMGAGVSLVRSLTGGAAEPTEVSSLSGRRRTPPSSRPCSERKSVSISHRPASSFPAAPCRPLALRPMCGGGPRSAPWQRRRWGSTSFRLPRGLGISCGQP